MWNWRSCQTAGSEIKRDVPGMVRPWREREPNLADNLCPHVQRCARFFPLAERQCRPGFRLLVPRCHQSSILNPLPAIEKIPERSPHPIEHAAAFVLGPAKRFAQTLSNRVKNAAFFAVFALLIYVVIGLDVLH